MSAGTAWKWTGLGRRTRSSRWCWQKRWPKQQQQRHKQPNSSWLTSDFENKVEYVDLLTNTKLPIKIVFTHNDCWSQTKHSVAPDNALISHNMTKGNSHWCCGVLAEPPFYMSWSDKITVTAAGNTLNQIQFKNCKKRIVNVLMLVELCFAARWNESSQVSHFEMHFRFKRSFSSQCYILKNWIASNFHSGVNIWTTFWRSICSC